MGGQTHGWTEDKAWNDPLASMAELMESLRLDQVPSGIPRSQEPFLNPHICAVRCMPHPVQHPSGTWGVPLRPRPQAGTAPLFFALKMPHSSALQRRRALLLPEDTPGVSVVPLLFRAVLWSASSLESISGGPSHLFHWKKCLPVSYLCD